LQRQPGAGLAVVQHLRLFVKLLPDAVAAELAHHRVAGGFGVVLDRVADVAQPRPRAHALDAFPHRLVGDGAQAQRCWGCAANRIHAAGVAVPAVFDHGDVDVDDVAALERLVVGDAVADHLVDRGADAFGVGRIAAGRVVERRRDGLLHADDVVVRQPVELVGADAGLHQRAEVVEHFGSEPASAAHAFDAGGVLEGYSHGVYFCRYWLARQGAKQSPAVWKVVAVV